MKSLAYFLLFCLCINKLVAQELPSLFDKDVVHRIELSTDNQGLWKEMATNYRDETKRKIYLPVTAKINGKSYPKIGLRFKGNFSYAFAWTNKKPLKIKLDEFEDQNYQGTTKFNLSNAFEDPSFQRDVLSLNVMAQLGVPSPRASYAQVYLNGVFFGIYILIEQLDKPFLTSHFDNDNGELYESNGFCFEDCESEFKELERKGGDEDVKDKNLFLNVCRLLNTASDADLYGEIQKIFSVESFLKSCAVNVYLGNKDSYPWGQCRNYYLYQSDAKKLEWIAWDHNLSFGYDPKILGENFLPQKAFLPKLFKRLMNSQQGMAVYYQAIDDVFHYTKSWRFKKYVKQNAKMLSPLVAQDPNTFYGQDTFKMSLRQEIIGGLNSKIPGIFSYLKQRQKLWKAFKREEELLLK